MDTVHNTADPTNDELMMRLVAYAGAAKSSYVAALRASRAAHRTASTSTADISPADKSMAKQALELLHKAEANMHEASLAHLELLRRSAETPDDLPFSLLLVHAEDQLSSSETFKLLAEEFCSDLEPSA